MLLSSLQSAVSCISRAVIRSGPAGPGAPQYFRIADRYVPLRGRSQLEFSLQHTFRVEQQDDLGDWTASTTGYFYQLQERSGPELIAFHWHPHQPNQPDFPHLHMRSHSGSVEIARKQHVPTGRVSLESDVRFAIVELGVRPLRADWEDALNEGEQYVAEHRRW